MLTVVVPAAVVVVDTSPAVVVAAGIEAVVDVKADSIVAVIGLVAKLATTAQLVVKADSVEAAVTGKRLAPSEEDAMNVRRVVKADSIVAVVIVQPVAKAVDLTEAVVIVQLVVSAAVVPNQVLHESQIAVRIARILEFIGPSNRAKPRQLNEPRPSVALEQRHHRRSKSTLKSGPKRSKQASTSFYLPPSETVNSFFPVAVFC